MSCEVCALQRKVVTRAFLHPLEIATAPFEVIGMDFLGPVKPASLSGNKYVLVLTDAFSKWTEVVALPNQTAETTCRALMDKIILYHGPPKVIITDRGTNFTSRLFNNLCRELKTKHKTTTAYHPQANGMTERFNKTMVEMIRKYIADGFERWEEVLGPMASAYRNSVHASTMETPYFLITARDPNMVVDRFLIPEKELITPEDYKSQTLKRLREGFTLARKNLLDARLRQKIQYDKRAKICKLQLGD
jgi:transposase InsO family protein